MKKLLMPLVAAMLSATAWAAPTSFVFSGFLNSSSYGDFSTGQAVQLTATFDYNNFSLATSNPTDPTVRGYDGSVNWSGTVGTHTFNTSANTRLNVFNDFGGNDFIEFYTNTATSSVGELFSLYFSSNSPTSTVPDPALLGASAIVAASTSSGFTANYFGGQAYSQGSLSVPEASLTELASII